MSARNLTLCLGAALAAATAATSVTAAEPPPATSVTQRAFAYYEKGPDQLRQFIHRTRTIYQLYYVDVVNAYDAARAAKAAAVAEPARVAAATPEPR
ncbi:MAG: hypothetical protein AMXMBFR42_16230 [Burkholderiales bacterium]